MFRIVDTNGAVYRIGNTGPASNLDGGIVRLVEPDGTIWTQATSGAPLSIVDTTGTVVDTILMSSDWIQPPDQARTISIPNIYLQSHVVYGPGDPDFPGEDTTEVNYGTRADMNPAPTLSDTTGSHPGFQNWAMHQVILGLFNCPAPQVPPPSIPPGSTVEYEAASGVLLTGRVRASLLNAKDIPASADPTGVVYEIPDAQVNPGVPIGESGYPNGAQYATSHGAQVFITSTVDTDPDGPGPQDYTVQPFTTPYQTFPSAQRVGWRSGTTMSATEAPIPENTSYSTYLHGWPANLADPRRTPLTSILADYTYRPPRYRFV